MTAEIVILNRTAVAMAADSAVTIGDSKIYNSVNKLFTLSKYHPVGIMIYGNADYMNIPWETIIKLYRETRGSKKHSTVEKYAKDFLRFIDSRFSISKEAESRRILQIWLSYFSSLSGHLRRALLDRNANTQMGLTRADVIREFGALLDKGIASLKATRTLPQYQRITAARACKRYQTEFDAAKQSAFRGRPITKAIDKKLEEYAGLLLIKPEFRLAVSGLVFSGFGDDEIFPALYHVRCAGKILGRLKLMPNKYQQVTAEEENSVFITPFAQGEMVHLFMEGVDRDYSTYIRSYMTTLVEELSEHLIAKLSSGTKTAKRARIDAARKVAKKLVDEFEQSAKRVRYSRFIKPTLDVVSILPKEELAELAGALVNITSLKRKISMDAETVGGPIDVAVISKGDGFVWIKRKHYFKPELNPTFLQRYLSEKST